MNQQNIEAAAKNACLELGIDYKGISSDGLFHSTNITNDPRGRGDGRIKIFPDRQGGIAWNHKSGERQLFFIDRKSNASMTDQEREEIKQSQQRRERELIAKQNKAALKAQSLWASAKQAPQDHPYLVKKRVKPYFTRQASWDKSILGVDKKWKKITIDNALLVPLCNEAGGVS